MRTLSLRGLPTVMPASLAPMASAAASYTSAGTRMRRIAVHFWPDFTVISRTTSRTSRLKASLPGASPGSNRALLRLSASMLARTERWATAAWARITPAVSAEPVNDTTSNGWSWSISPAELPAMTDSAPTGNTPASTTSWTMRCVSHAVAVAGLTMTGMPDNRAGAAFSHSPQAGKLKALMNSATPCRGTCRCCDRNTGSLPSFTAPPSRRARTSPKASPHLAYWPRVKMAPSMSTAEWFLTVPALAVAMS